MPGSVAAQAMAWQRRMGGTAGPLSASAETSTGQPVQVELLVAGQWVDITSYALVRDDSGEIGLTWGIRDEGNNVSELSTLRAQLKNQDGRFTPRNPSGPYFGLIGRNQPVRVSVPDGNGGKSYRSWAEISRWPTSWDPTGTDVWVDVAGAGLMQRLAQGPVPERSVIYSAWTDPIPSTLVAYWPGEDADGATTLASALTNGSPMTMSGSPTLASYDGFGASDPLPDLSAGYLSGGVIKYADPTAHQVRFLCFIPRAGLTDGKVICSIDQADYSAGSPQFWELYYSTSSNSLVLRTFASDSTSLGVDLAHTLDVRGRQLYVSIEQEESGTGVTRAIRITDVPTGRVYSVTDTAALTQLTRVVRVQFGPASRSAVGPIGTQYLPGVAVGHVTVETAITATTALGRRLNPIGETAGRRIQRLCGEEGLPFEWIGDLDDTTPMGAQGKATPIALMQECALADGGMLYESTDSLGLGYRTRASLYNQDPALVLDYTAFNLSEVPVPVEDDQRLANRVTVTVNGVSATYEETSGALSTAPPPAGVGVYGPSDSTLNLASSDRPTLLDQAAWRVHLGTVDEPRFPQISVNLAHSSFVNNPALKRAVLALRQGDRVQIVNPPIWASPDTIDQVILGGDESINHFQHRLTFGCAPASPYSVGSLDTTTARIDTSGSQLATAATSSATSLVVAPTADQDGLWTTDTAETPWTIRVGGEIMTVTAVTSAAKDTFTRATVDAWGTADVGGTWTCFGGSAVDFDVTGSAGTHTMTSVDASRRSFLTSPAARFDVYVDIATSALATGSFIYAGSMGRYLDIDNFYTARLAFSTTATITLAMRKWSAGSESAVGTPYLSPLTHVAGTFYRLRFQGNGSTLRAKVWQVGDIEPPEWHTTATDSDLPAAGSVGVRSILATTNTNVNPVISYDNFELVNPQIFTVTRSVNGVSKAQTAGTDVRLANPTYLAL